MDHVTAEDLFVHPAADGPVGVGWTSLIEGRVRIRGLVKDGYLFGDGDGNCSQKGDFSVIATPQLSGYAAGCGKGAGRLAMKEIKIEHAYGAAEGKWSTKTALARRPDRRGRGGCAENIDLLGGQKVTEGSGRLQLAEWIGHPDNPLTARDRQSRLARSLWSRPRLHA